MAFIFQILATAAPLLRLFSLAGDSCHKTEKPNCVVPPSALVNICLGEGINDSHARFQYLTKAEPNDIGFAFVETSKFALREKARVVGRGHR